MRQVPLDQRSHRFRAIWDFELRPPPVVELIEERVAYPKVDGAAVHFVGVVHSGIPSL